MRLPSFRAWLGLLFLLLALPLHAQTLGDIDVRAQGELRIVRVRFNASVGYLQIAPTGAADLYTLRFDLLAADDPVLRQSADESRRLPAADGLPEIGIGYSPEPASRIRQLTVRLASPMPVTARQGPNARSIELVVRVAAPEAAAAPASAASAPEGRLEAATVAGAAAPEIEREAQGLLAQARAALLGRNAEAAVGPLNQLLKLPPNTQSQAAQELIGQAWEEAGNPARAKAEYQLYLKLYPEGEGAKRVGQRLAALGGPVVAAAPGAPPPREQPKHWSGSIAQYYYGGKAKSQSLVPIARGADQATLSKTTESSIVTSFDISGRWADERGEGGETRAVLRGSGSKNLLKDSGHSGSSVGAAYVEYRNGARGQREGIAVRAGRQSPISGGLLGLFDGVSVAWPVGEGIKLDLMGGRPASALVSSPSERLAAAVLEVDTFLERFGGNVYLLNQTTQGFTNRRALGGELRYAGDRFSLNTLLDYDTGFAKFNAVSVHGSFQAGAQTTVTLLVDERRAPSLQLNDALISSGYGSLQEMLEKTGKSVAELRIDALNTSATARQVLLSVSRPLNERWQASGDLRYSAVGALPDVNGFQATAATGAQISFGAQLTGTNLYSKRDIHNFNLNVMSTPQFKGLQVSYNNLSTLPNNPDLTLEPSLRLYTQKGPDEQKILRIGPGMRSSWRFTPRVSLLAELLLESSRLRAPDRRDDTNSVFFYVGYRAELF